MWFNPFDVEFSKEYSELKNKPKINGIELSGNKSWSDLGLANPMHIAGIVNTVQDLPATANEGDVYIVGLQNEEKVEYVYTINGWEYLGTMAVQIDDAMSTTSENPVQNKVVNAAKQDKIDTDHKLDADLVSDLSSTNKFVTATEKDQISTNATNIANLQQAKADKSNTYTKTEIDTALNAKQNVLTFDSAPTNNSTNPVTSGGVYTALAGKSTVTIDANGNLFVDGNQIWAVVTSAEYEALAIKTLPFYFIKE